MTASSNELSWWIRASTAMFGLAVAAAIALAPVLQPGASAGELPGAMQARGLSARGPALQWALAVILPFVGAFAAQWVIPRLTGWRWASVGYVVATISAPVPLLASGNLRHVLLHAFVAAVIVAARRVDPQFSTRDVTLIPALLFVYVAFLKLGVGGTPIGAFEFAAIALFLLRLLLRRPLPLPRALYPILLVAYLLTLLGVTTPQQIDFFEDGHDLLPASEMLRGEVPYRDIAPMHGLISDGGLSLLALKLGGDDIGTALIARRVVGALTIAAICFVAFAATGSAEAGLLAGLLMIAMFPATTMGVRALPALLALAATCLAVRGRPSYLVPLLCAVSFAFSIDFAIYSTLVALAAMLWMRGWRVAGALAVVLVVALIAFWPVLAGSSVYVIGPLAPPACLTSLSAMTAFATDPHCFSALVWIAALIFAAVNLAMRRIDPATVIAMWVVVTGLSYVERHHFYYEYAVPPLLVMWLWSWGAALSAARLREDGDAISGDDETRRGDRGAPQALLIVVTLLVFIAKPFTHLFDVAAPLVLSPTPAATPISGMPRTSGAVFDDTTRRALEAAQRASLQPGETFFDFANGSLLYYFTNRDCPIPWMEAPLYESEERQRKVIAMLEANPRIAAVLLAFPGAQPVIDGIDNKIRAPLVWAYVEKHYEPWIHEAGVVMWKRRGSS